MWWILQEGKYRNLDNIADESLTGEIKVIMWCISKNFTRNWSLYYVEEIDGKLSGKHIKIIKTEVATLAKAYMFGDL